jgi:hypothetical protein
VSGAPLVIYVDVDETLIRNYGTSRIKIPGVIAHVRLLAGEGAELYCWSSGGADYARRSAEECGLADCFRAYLPKPQVMIDDQAISAWRRLVQVHPNQTADQTLADYRAQLGQRPDQP